MSAFEDNLKRYATQLAVHGLNVQRGMLVQITAEALHRELALLVADAAYERGAAYVNIDLLEPRLARTRILKSNESDLLHVPKFVIEKYRELMETNGANLRLVGPEFPLVMADLDPKRVNSTQLAVRHALKFFYEDGIGKSKIHWTVAAAVTPAWAARIYPELPVADAVAALWNNLFSFSRADSSDYLQAWSDHGEKLAQRAEKLTAVGIRRLKFSGPTIDLVVGLSERAIFRGGPEKSTRGVFFGPNIPTEECFTTPDWRTVEGHAQATRPFLVNGKLIHGLEMQFNKGELVDFSATEGADTFREYISSDPGARRLGEVALVGIDSPIFQANRVFEEILLDENAACHVAIGSAYKFCLRGGEEASQAELETLGCNESSVHTDMMLSSEQVSVAADLRDGREILIIDHGKWSASFS